MVTQVPIQPDPIQPDPIVTLPAEERVILDNISWETFDRLLPETGDHRNTRFYYLDGTLEIMSPWFVHESSNRFIEALISAAVEELGMNLRRAGSVTLRLKPKKVRAEPDSSYYIQNEALVWHLTELDLKKDPPPDLVVEVDITSSSDRRMPIYARLGIPTFWQYHGQSLQYYVLQDSHYVAVQSSSTLPTIPAAIIVEYLQKRLEIGESPAIR